MTTSVMTPSKIQQPAVLHLLPFSRNVPSPASKSRKSISHSVTMATEEDTQDSSRTFPVLAVTRSERTPKLRSKSAGVTLYNFTSQSTDGDTGFGNNRKQQQRLLRANSERLSRGQVASFVKSRAKSEYSDRPEAVRCSVRDINDDILGAHSTVLVDVNNNNRSKTGNSKSNSNVSFSPEPLLIPINDKKTKALPKPTAKSKDGLWASQNRSRYWKSSTSNSNESHTKYSNNVDVNPQLHTKAQRRVKLNVNELPRSKTPITENDPDKLNMKNVIAFLQSNSKDSGNLEPNVNPSSPLSGRLPTRSARDASPLKVGRNGVISSKHYTVPARSLDTHQSDTMAGRDEAVLGSSGFRPKSYHAGMGGGALPDRRIVKSEYSTHMVGNSEDIPRPKSLHANRNIQIPESIRKIRENEDHKRPFRLHRFVTLVPEGSANLLNSAESKSVHVQNARTRSNYSRDSITSLTSNPRSGSVNSIRHKVLLSRRPSEQAAMNALLETEKTIIQREARRRNKRAAQNDSPQHAIHNVDTVIKMPRAQYMSEQDPDESEDFDEDNVPFPTVPNSRNKRAKTLSADGRAMTPVSDISKGASNSRTSPTASRPSSMKERRSKAHDNENDYGGSQLTRDTISQFTNRLENEKAYLNRLPSVERARDSNSMKGRSYGHASSSRHTAHGMDKESSHGSPTRSLPEWAKEERMAHQQHLQQLDASSETSKSTSNITGSSSKSSHSIAELEGRVAKTIESKRSPYDNIDSSEMPPLSPRKNNTQKKNESYKQETSLKSLRFSSNVTSSHTPRSHVQNDSNKLENLHSPQRSQQNVNKKTKSSVGDASPQSSQNNTGSFFLTSMITSEPTGHRTLKVESHVPTDSTSGSVSPAPQSRGSGSPVPPAQKEQQSVKLSLRKERNRTRELTYMVDGLDMAG